jgi:hypothetical protein
VALTTRLRLAFAGFFLPEGDLLVPAEATAALVMTGDFCALR